ncbi:hypothetical protein CEY12_07245 [Chryseobacterium sp. T16E-39]|uniref:hypothetical protein n=1 Tax=Chryseobacterium sp. T16E-39 TaxID=2015076 RepID=UPI000B5B39DC|nr:hypothetical protein [Chryseobacterium sp. T16E-39]ASK29911.1 hypothetical protein CEY12_07245 [Chryseobacterium sp. T16E-39]
MKTFFTYDFYIQLIIFTVISGIVLIGLIHDNEKIIYLFYFGIGILQSVSYLIRCSYKYEKSLLFKIYGYVIMPIFPSLLGLAIFGNTNFIAFIFIVIPVLSFFYSPIMAILYVRDTYLVFKNKDLNFEQHENIK